MSDTSLASMQKRDDTKAVCCRGRYVMRGRKKRAKAERRGRHAEHIAATWLTLTGWKIQARRARSAVGEIDLIASKRKRLAFIEVKYRRSQRDALHSVSLNQKNRFLRAGTLWLAQNESFCNHALQYDLIIMTPWRLPMRIQSAFYADNIYNLDLI